MNTVVFRLCCHFIGAMLLFLQFAIEQMSKQVEEYCHREADAKNYYSITVK